MLKTRLRHILAALALTLGPSLSEAVNLDSLLIVSIGGRTALERLATVDNYRTEGTVSINGQQGTFVSVYAKPDRVYFELSLGSVSIVHAYDGQVAWQRDFNGVTSRLEGFEKRELLGQAYFQSYSFLFDDRMPGGREYRGTAVIDGRTCHEIALVPLNTDTVLVYLDVETGLQRLMISWLDNTQTRTTADDYRDVSGIRIPFFSRAEIVGAPLVLEFSVGRVLFDQPLDDALFRQPAAGQVDFRFPADVRSVTVPFDFSFGHIYVTGTVNGRKRARFILDSGASANVFHEPILSDLNLPSVGSLPAKGIGGYREVTLVRIDSVNIGPLTLLDQVAGAVNLEGIGRAGSDGTPFGGVLGFDFLSRFPVLIDYAGRQLTVYEPGSRELPAGGSEVPFHLTMHVPTIEARLVGTEGDFLIDLGSPFGVMVHAPFVERHNLDQQLQDIRPISRTLSGLGGSVKGRSAYAASFAFGDVRVESLRVLLPEGGEGISGSEELAGSIGNLLLEQFRVLFDFGNNRLIFYERAESAK
ncbi:MAG TPA: aspartyl protease family protein [Acidobacteriota bacterium]|nr:aspartyl protease family protein [Acidobacteriota bacterium]